MGLEKSKGVIAAYEIPLRQWKILAVAWKQRITVKRRRYLYLKIWKSVVASNNETRSLIAPGDSRRWSLEECDCEFSVLQQYDLRPVNFKLGMMIRERK